MDVAGVILIGIGVNTFINGVWLLLYNNQNKLIEKNYEEHKNKINTLENSINNLISKEKK